MWTEQDQEALIEYLKKEGYEKLKLFIENRIEMNTLDLLQSRNIDCIVRINELSTLLKLLDNART